ncbi:Aste57867_1816 [Aphanomyces stellatus]|uniref:Alpha-mannosidase n=1 Tax=Aphanomyces stellatus TaxID=120398 RepID=A0A485KAD4_9STRA|nr:hypothetical protein As57867_001814 [Aphanomyces stellatus]VFT79025.1 Aste57867_1816 [Aphanomyces stellatus]
MRSTQATTYVCFVLVLWLGLVADSVQGWTIPPDVESYNTTFPGYSTSRLNVHLVPHSHDDVGWLKTVDQYFYGTNDTIQTARVQFILDAVVRSLAENPDRRFIYVEQAFFTRWWARQGPKIKALTRQLVASRQLEFTNGGWCQHDEATTYFVDMIDQMTLGHRFLKAEFNVTPTIGWQIDTFGHSSTQASLLAAKLGFDGIYFARIDQKDYDHRKKSKTLEFQWQPRGALATRPIFTGVLQSHYESPSGFNFERDDGVCDDIESETFNLDTQIDAFVSECLARGANQPDDHLMVVMGSDFAFENAHEWFTKMDKLIHYANEDGRINLFYSTPAQYTAAKLAQPRATWTTYTGDFFPYGTSAIDYWTGYFTTRPALKRLTRVASGVLQTARQLNVFSQSRAPLDVLERAVAVVQHHDGVSGTSKQHVAFDYAKRLGRGLAQAESAVNSALQRLLAPAHATYSLCWHMNVSACGFTATHSNFSVVVYNPQPFALSVVIRIPVQTDQATVSHDEHMNAVLADVFPTFGPNLTSTLPFWLSFYAELPPLGLQTFHVSTPTTTSIMRSLTTSLRHESNKPPQSLRNAHVELTFSPCGAVSSLTLLGQEPSTIDLSFGFYFYEAASWDEQPSGAYVFQPAIPKAQMYTPACPTKWSHFRGQLVQEMRHEYDNRASVVFRVTANSSAVEIEWTVESIDIADSIGKDIVARFTSSIASQGAFYTDANGRDFVHRSRPATVLFPAAHYFPVTSALFIHDAAHQLSVVTDRAQGGTSLHDGDLELMVHRRGLTDDHKGVDEPINEPSENHEDQVPGVGLRVTGTFQLLFTTYPETLRQAMDAVYQPPLVAFAPIHVRHVTSFVDAATLSPGLQLVTLQQWTPDTLLVRLGSSNANASLTVDLSTLFPTLHVLHAEERTTPLWSPAP